MAQNAKANKQKSFFAYNEIAEAYKDCKRNKSNTSNAIEFAMGEPCNLIELLDEINNGTYEIGPSIAFVATYPKYREVFAADFRDRIVHHLVIRELMSYMEVEFIDNAFACREGKGVFYGIKALAQDIKECTCGYTKDAWILKMDFKAFFMSIEKALLRDCVLNFIKEKYPENRKKEPLLRLCEQIIMHHPERNCRKRGNETLWRNIPDEKTLFVVGDTKGLPIGNLPSQIFETLFMTAFDKYVTNELGFKYYGRYVDDFYIVCEEKERLKKAMPLMAEFAKEKLHLTLHPEKRYLQHYSKGVMFIGGYVKPGRIMPSNRLIDSLEYKIRVLYSEPSKEKLENMVACVNSYLGFLRQFNAYRIRKNILRNNEHVQRWIASGVVEIGNDYGKLQIVKNGKSNRKTFEMYAAEAEEYIGLSMC